MTGDILSDVLRVVRLSGAFFYRVDATAPWWVESSAALEQEPRVLPECEHLIPYHVLVEGTCWAELAGGTPAEMQAGDVVVFPHGGAHFMSSAPGLRDPMEPIEFPSPSRLPFAVAMGAREGPRATLVCGFLGCDRSPFNPLVSALPVQLLVRGVQGGWLSAFTQHVLAEAHARRAGGELVLTCLAELMFIAVVRQHVESLPPQSTGWLAGLRDPLVGRALAALHERPAHAWTLQELANSAATSRTVLAERFAALVGDPPMQYLARWRMQLAAEQLAHSTDKLSAIAARVGYESEAAFSRAFRKLVGASPSHWRARHSAQPAGNGRSG